MKQPSAARSVMHDTQKKHAIGDINFSIFGCSLVVLSAIGGKRRTPRSIFFFFECTNNKYQMLFYF